jgi:hypothetical protein
MRPTLVSLVLLIGTSGLPAAQGPDAAVRGLLSRAAVWVASLEQELTVVVADERYHQQIGTERYPNAPRENFRALQSEVVFLWVPEAGMWLTARNVRTVDGEAVDGSSDRVARVLAEASARLQLVRGLRAESAKFNLGSIYRDFNDPTFAVQFLADRWQGRFKWERHGRTRVGGVETSRVDFTEIQQPYVIEGTQGDRLQSTGSVWIDDRTGVVYRSELNVWDPRYRTRARIDVDLAMDATLGVVVPVRMNEEYGISRETTAIAGLAPPLVIFGDADYTNFHRFETSGRLITPP